MFRSITPCSTEEVKDISQCQCLRLQSRNIFTTCLGVSYDTVLCHMQVRTFQRNILPPSTGRRVSKVTVIHVGTRIRGVIRQGIQEAGSICDASESLSIAGALSHTDPDIDCTDWRFSRVALILPGKYRQNTRCPFYCVTEDASFITSEQCALKNLIR